MADRFEACRELCSLFYCAQIIVSKFATFFYIHGNIHGAMMFVAFQRQNLWCKNTKRNGSNQEKVRKLGSLFIESKF